MDLILVEIGKVAECQASIAASPKTASIVIMIPASSPPTLATPPCTHDVGATSLLILVVM